MLYSRIATIKKLVRKEIGFFKYLLYLAKIQNSAIYFISVTDYSDIDISYKIIDRIINKNFSNYVAFKEWF